MIEQGVSVQFLGSGDAFGSGGRFQACILLRSAGNACLVDCGASSLVALKGAGIDPNEIDAILISHLHGDHFGGIPFFVLDAQLVSRRTKPLSIAGPPGLQERVRAAMEVFFPGSSDVKRKFDIVFTELAPRAAEAIGPLSVAAFPVVHASGAPSYALRLECSGRTIAYSGDTEWTESLIEASAGADLFICEAYYFDKLMKFHLDYRTLMAHRDEFSCGRIILTHMNADMLSRLEGVALDAASDGLVVHL